eukprot:TRINITY_DN9587_c3_g1_i2.p8 TRINITY_DN9587_c3_g1~~TRINITY_DN9587_c3_g1_i2.p8  ORF type:complete len:104 (-),score=2.96 TRINITY_DN9587_c3_g1_i2:1227-1538(-)
MQIQKYYNSKYYSIETRNIFYNGLKITQFLLIVKILQQRGHILTLAQLLELFNKRQSLYSKVNLQLQLQGCGDIDISDKIFPVVDTDIANITDTSFKITDFII